MNKKVIVILVMVWIALSSISTMFTVNRYKPMEKGIISTTTADQAAKEDDAPVKKANDEMNAYTAMKMPGESDIAKQVPQDSHSNVNVDEGTKDIQQSSGEKVDVKKIIETYENILAMWFESEKTAVSDYNAADAETISAVQNGDNSKTIATFSQIDKAKDSLTLKDKLRLSMLVAKIGVSDIKVIIDMAKDGVTLQEAKEMDKIIKKHLSPEEVQELESFVQSHIKAVASE